MFKRILIANRAEIALRVVKTARQMNIETITIFTEIEKDYPHAQAGDININLGEGPLSETYLNMDLLLSIAKEHGAEAIHPGYGLLSENPLFAKKVKDAGITLIGPEPEQMVLMGDKKQSKIEMERIGIPTIPGYHGDNQEPGYLFEQAKKVGLPLLIKASAGGGGKGMRVVRSYDDFMESLASAKSEALKSFADDTVLIERYIENPRHIEVQVMSDKHGNHLHFFERECSIQRRHQKIVEETPSVALDTSLRQEICECAVKIAKNINYVGAGTVEFILDEKGEFFFLEMNTRLQVEHPITEMVTGSDLVKLQLLVAAGEKLPMLQDEVQQHGHAIEVRLYAEDPDNNFMPVIGDIWKLPVAKQARFDNGFVAGNSVTINFDPMLSKLVVWAETRESAISKMSSALEQTAYMGLKTNRDYLKRVIDSVPFNAGKITTNFTNDYKELLSPKENSRSQALAIARYLLQTEMESNVWSEQSGFRNV